MLYVSALHPAWGEWRAGTGCLCWSKGARGTISHLEGCTPYSNLSALMLSKCLNLAQDLISVETICFWAEWSHDRSSLSKSHQYLTFFTLQMWDLQSYPELVLARIHSPLGHSSDSPLGVVTEGTSLASIHQMLWMGLWASLSFHRLSFPCSRYVSRISSK